MSGLIRRDPLDDLFRGFFVRPVEYGSQPDAPAVKIDVKEGERELRSERYFGKVSRSFQLAQEIDEAQVTAKYTDGVLELALPKKAATQARRITIQ